MCSSLFPFLCLNTLYAVHNVFVRLTMKSGLSIRGGFHLPLYSGFLIIGGSHSPHPTSSHAGFAVCVCDHIVLSESR